MVDVHFQAALLSLSVYFDPIIQLFLIRARDPLSYNERLGEGLQESGRRRGGAIHNQLRNYLIEPSSVGEIASTISSGFASMTPINVEDQIHEQFRQSSALGEMERYIVSDYVYCHSFYSVACSFIILLQHQSCCFYPFMLTFYPSPFIYYR